MLVMLMSFIYWTYIYYIPNYYMEDFSLELCVFLHDVDLVFLVQHSRLCSNGKVLSACASSTAGAGFLKVHVRLTLLQGGY